MERNVSRKCHLHVSSVKSRAIKLKAAIIQRLSKQIVKVLWAWRPSVASVGDILVQICPVKVSKIDREYQETERKY